MEELKECMLKLEKIKRIIHNFQQTRCNVCGYNLEIITLKIKTKYHCKGCGNIFYENQYHEVYFEEIEKVMKE